jgi:hypothetical protein
MMERIKIDIEDAVRADIENNPNMKKMKKWRLVTVKKSK